MTLPERPPVPGLSGERFNVTYLLTGSEDEARALAEVIKIEQSVEFPAALIPDGDIRDHLVGRVEAFKPAGEGSYYATISFAVEGAGRELTQLLNMMWGTGSLLSNMKVDRVKLPDSLLAAYRGPRFGTQGFREILQVWDRPLLCTAIKPMGLSPADLAEMAYRCALGGIDIIKDDHGITDQTFAPLRHGCRRWPRQWLAPTSRPACTASMRPTSPARRTGSSSERWSPSNPAPPRF